MSLKCTLKSGKFRDVYFTTIKNCLHFTGRDHYVIPCLFYFLFWFSTPSCSRHIVGLPSCLATWMKEPGLPIWPDDKLADSAAHGSHPSSCFSWFHQSRQPIAQPQVGGDRDGCPMVGRWSWALRIGHSPKLMKKRFLTDASFWCCQKGRCHARHTPKLECCQNQPPRPRFGCISCRKTFLLVQQQLSDVAFNMLVAVSLISPLEQWRESSRAGTVWLLGNQEICPIVSLVKTLVSFYQMWTFDGARLF